MSDIEASIAPLARGQHGCISHRQLVDLGVTQRQINRRLATGAWISLERGVYAVATSSPTWRRQVMAAVLGRSRAVASGTTAAVLHQLPGFRPAWPEVTIPALRSPDSDLATVHRRADFDGIATTIVDAIPAVTAAEALSMSR